MDLVAAGLLGSSVSINYEMLFAFRVMTGSGSAMVPPNCGAVVADLVSPQNRGKYIGRLTGVGITAAAVGAHVAAVLFNFGGWRA